MDTGTMMVATVTVAVVDPEGNVAGAKVLSKKLPTTHHFRIKIPLEFHNEIYIECVDIKIKKNSCDRST